MSTPGVVSHLGLIYGAWALALAIPNQTRDVGDVCRIAPCNSQRQFPLDKYCTTLSSIPCPSIPLPRNQWYCCVSSPGTMTRSRHSLVFWQMFKSSLSEICPHQSRDEGAERRTECRREGQRFGGLTAVPASEWLNESVFYFSLVTWYPARMSRTWRFS